MQCYVGFQVIKPQSEILGLECLACLGNNLIFSLLCHCLPSLATKLNNKTHHGLLWPSCQLAEYKNSLKMVSLTYKTLLNKPNLQLFQRYYWKSEFQFRTHSSHITFWIVGGMQKQLSTVHWATFFTSNQST